MFLCYKNGANRASGQGFPPLDEAQNLGRLRLSPSGLNPMDQGLEISLSTWTEPWPTGLPVDRNQGLSPERNQPCADWMRANGFDVESRGAFRRSTPTKDASLDAA